MSRLVRDRRGARRPAAGLPVPGQRPGGGDAGQAPGARHARRPPHPADGPGRDLRRHRPARAAARRARERRGARPGQAAGDPPADLDADAGREAGPRPRSGGAAARGGVRRLHPARRRLALRDQGRPDPRRPAHPRRRPGRRRAGRPGARDPARPPDVGRRAEPAGPARGAGPARRRAQGPGRRGRGAGARPRRGHGGRRLGRPTRSPAVRRRALATPRQRWPIGQVERVLRFAAEEVVPRLDATVRGDPARPARPRRRLHPRRPVRLAAARAGQRAADRPELLLRRPQGRPVAAGVGDRAGDGRVAGRALPRATTTARTRAASACRVWGTRAMRTSGDDIAEVLRAARGPPGLGRGVPPRRPARGDRPRRAGPPAHRRHRPHLRLLP